ncbi:hypothetical protein F2P81_022479 [Scophthalmus maximus]|uniref:Uncharacterized protein n=1 Tax=Scophthalmus maximus TaxID=52904 RepID=A0A6A4S0D2_SCOMX|nr:hypothetical protein F2P81_022479 [Scophthalmus maximus]
MGFSITVCLCTYAVSESAAAQASQPHDISIQCHDMNKPLRFLRAMEPTKSDACKMDDGQNGHEKDFV